MRNIPYLGLFFILAISIILVIPAAIFGVCTLFDYNPVYGEYDPVLFELSFENAPEGAVGIEPLIRSDDGKYAAVVVEERGENWVRLNESPEELQKRCGAFKAAYVDENGNVLGVTGAARMRYGVSEAPRLAANSDKLEYFTGSVTGWQSVVLITVFSLEPLAIAALIAVIVLAVINSVCEAASERRRS